MALKDVVAKIREVPLHEIEIVRGELAPKSDIYVIALYHPTFCPTSDDVWVYTAVFGSEDQLTLVNLAADIRGAKNLVAAGMQQHIGQIVEPSVIGDAPIELDEGPIV